QEDIKNQFKWGRLFFRGCLSQSLPFSNEGFKEWFLLEVSASASQNEEEHCRSYIHTSKEKPMGSIT
ncbi:MAG: hypothetical protein QGH12_04845, partial [SAR324 cluster bacterium]|nr:hypothetical protein [SAR324 cluster bacterium]